jgi:hypothetical protein
VSKWLDNYRRERSEKTPAKVDASQTFCASVATPSPVATLPLSLLTASPFLYSDHAGAAKRLKTKRGLVSELEQENGPAPPAKVAAPLALTSPVRPVCLAAVPRSPLKPFNENVALTPQRHGAVTPVKAASSPARPVRPAASPAKTLNLKKRWLKEVVQEQKQLVLERSARRDDDVENLAVPIRWSDHEAADFSLAVRRRSPTAWSVASALVELAERDLSNNQPLNLSTSRRN